MQPFEWSATFVTGIAKVDAQHQQLVTMINEFGAALTDESLSTGTLLGIFHELAEYARTHFTDEEQLMVARGLDSRHLERHLGQHHSFIVEINNLAGCIHENTLTEGRPLFQYLVHWLAYHILGTDQNMARQCSALSEGLSSEEAYAQEERRASRTTEPLLHALDGLFSLVSQRNRALAELNATLEQRVAERTRELKQANQALQEISITDHLTGLPNRRFGMQQLQMFWEESRQHDLPLSLLMVDADGFKEINDRYGHDAGDVVLQRLATELQDSIRSDDIICRLGGDEFLIICPATPLAGARQLAEAILHHINTLEVATGTGIWHGSVSIGVAARIAEMASSEELLKGADDAVYRAKKAGRNCVRQ